MDMKHAALLAMAPIAIAFVPAPAAAQDAPGDKVNILDVFGADPCPQSSENEIVVCRRMDEEERYRIPEALRQSDSPRNQSWSNRVKSFEAVGDFGPLSCTPIGLGGELGCTAATIAAAYEERRSGPGTRASEIIAAQRADRLSTIDAEAAATQARVEELERQYLERQQREEDEASEAPAPEKPVPVDPSAIPSTP
jgi:hypothetical protein